MTAPPPQAPAPSQPDGRRGKAPGRGRRRAKIVGVAALVSAALLATGVFIGTRSFVLTRVLEPQLESVLGAEVEVGEARFTSASTLRIRKVIATLDGVEGEAAEYLRVPEARVRLRWRGLLTGRMPVEEVRLDRPHFRLSRDPQDGGLNLDALRAQPPGAEDEIELPVLRLSEGVVEFGEHTGAAYESLAQITVQGALRPSRDEDGAYTVRLTETGDSVLARLGAGAVDEDPIEIRGEFNPNGRSGSVVLEHVDLAGWGPGAAPTDVREYWARLAVAGDVERTEFSYTPSEGVATTFQFRDVGLSLPLTPDPRALAEQAFGPTEDPSQRRIRMSRVSGEARFSRDGARARLEGYIEDLRYRVAIDSDGLSLDAPFRMGFETAEPFRVSDRPELLPFAPNVVRKRFRTFSGPTALVEAQVTLSRDADEEGNLLPLRVRGAISFRDGAARYDEFPYPITDLRGFVRFDENEVRIEEITGAGPTGARVFASGVIAPPRDGASVDLDIRLEGVPLDSHFAGALPPNRGDVFDTLFNAEAYRRLVQDGLVRKPGEEEPALAPEFALGGVGDLDIEVHRPQGDDMPYDWTARFALPRAGLLVKQFAYPAMATGAVVTITEERAVVQIDRVEGLAGGGGALEADIVLRRDGRSVFDPRIVIHATDIPIDERLLRTVPTRGADESGIDPRGSLRALGVRGTVDCVVTVLDRDDGKIGFDLDLSLAGAVAWTAGGDRHAGPVITDLTGRVLVSENALSFEGLHGLVRGSPLTIDGSIEYGRATSRAIDVRIDAPDLDVRTPVEHVVAAFSEDAAASIAALRERRPEGKLDASVDVRREAGAGAIVPTLRVERPQGLEFDAMEGRVAVEDGAAGAVVWTTGAVVFDGFSGALSFEGERSGTLSLDGSIPVAGAGAAEAGGASTVTLGVRDARWESLLLSRVLESLRTAASGFDRLATVLAERDVRGVFDARLRIDIENERRTLASALVEPRSLGLLLRGERALFDEVSGSVELLGDEAQFHDIALRAADLHIGLTGGASLSSGMVLDAMVQAEAATIDTRVLALLPEPAADAITAINLDAKHLRLTGGRLSLYIPEDPLAPSRDGSFVGVTTFTNGRFDLGGVRIEDVAGTLDIAFDPAAERPLDLQLLFDAARVEGIRVHDGFARVTSGDEPGTLIVPTIDAKAYRGRVFGSGRITLADEDGPARYQVSMQAAGLSLAELRTALRQVAGAEETPVDEESSVDASISIAGVAGEAASRVGRGSVRAWGGRVVRLPLVAPLIELSNLQAPLGEELDYAFASFFLDGERIRFEDMQIASSSVVLRGTGEMRWPDMALDLRVTSRAARRAPVLSALLEGLRDQIVVSRVRGTLAEPDVSVETLPGAREVLGSIFGDTPQTVAPTVARPVESRREPIRRADAHGGD